VNAALLSRCRVFVLAALGDSEIERLLRLALADPQRGLGGERVEFEPDAVEAIARLADGDARQALNLLELAVRSSPVADGARRVALATVRDAAQRRTVNYDKDREEHFNIASALIKSMRGSDPDAAVYWLARMLEGGEDPLFVARRLVIFASEDVGNADPRALMVAVASMQAVHFVGMPEAHFALSQAALYLAASPKSNAAGAAYQRAAEDVATTRNDPVPLHLRNAATGLMRGLGYGAGYQYAHDRPGGIVEHDHLPAGLAGRRYYEPTESGHEAAIGRWMAERAARRRARGSERGSRGAPAAPDAPPDGAG